MIDVSLKKAVANCLNKDQFFFRKRIQGAQKVTDERKRASIFERIESDIQKSIALCEKRRDALPKITYPEALPVSQKKDDIKDAIANHQVVIVAGETGSGKTTQLPKICLELGRGVKGFIGHTQPRRLAARSVAARIAEELECEIGQSVGFKIRFSDNVSDTSHVKLMTDGILLAEIQQDRFLSQYDTIIIDEAHERSLNIDFILGYLKNLLPKRPDLKVIITSATIDPERFSKHFNNAPIIEVSGRTFPVEVRYRPLTDIDIESADGDNELMQGIFDAVDELCQEGQGDILIFMNGEREIRDTAEALGKRNLKGVEILPLYARLSNAEQNRIFAAHSQRRIVLSTNVAETSLTVPGIRYVIDPGTARISRYSFRTKVQRLPIEAISRASAEQRKGRCGRVAAGVCIRLYSEDDFNGRPQFTDPEILRTNLASVILQMLSLGLGELTKFPFVQAPDNRNITDGMLLLEELQAIKPGQGKFAVSLTDTGRNLSRLPIDPRLAKMVLAAEQLGVLREVIIIVAALSIQDPRERPQDKTQAASEKHARFDDPDSDFIAFLNLWIFIEKQQSELSHNQFRKMCKQDFLAYMRVREWQDIVYQLTIICEEMGFKISEQVGDYERIHQSLLTGLLTQVGFKDDKQNYKGTRNSQFHIFPGSSLFKKSPKWVMSAELVETSKLYGRINARINVEWIVPLAQHLVKKSYSEPHWEKKPGAVVAFEQQTLFGLILVAKKRTIYSQIDVVLSRELFIREALVNQDLGASEGFLQHNQALIDEIHCLENKARRRDILVDEETLFAFYDERIPKDVNTRAGFVKWYKNARQQQADILLMDKAMLMQHEADGITAAHYPDVWQQNNLLLPLSYHFEPGKALDGVAVTIPIALLNQVEEVGFDWHIPALRHELICGLIKSLPKSLRRNFVPAPNYADAVLASITPMHGKLIDSVSQRLHRMTGVSVPAEAWDISTLDTHLKFQFQIIDDKGNIIAHGTDLSVLKAKLQNKVSDTLSAVAKPGIEQQGLIDWTFADLPQQYTQKQGNYEVKAFVALVDKKDSAAIELFDHPDKAKIAHQQGLRRLILLNIPSPIKYLQQHLPNKAKLGLYFNPFGKINDLIDDCISAGVDSLLCELGEIRDEQAFVKAKEHIRGELGDTVVKIAMNVEQVLSIAHQINKRMKGKVDLTMITAHGDIKSQLERLIFKGFVSHHGAQKITDLLRYFKAIEKRLEKLPIDPNRDRLCTLELDKVADAFATLKAKVPSGMPFPKVIDDIFWMQEELRVSLFAQTLGTAYPISAKRILNAIKEAEM
ncbi:ATP-dependent helicase HrpA [Pseudoalteromonas luteoviolacea B = ATCC 29581]|nr:ATP-dependent helicase HrpA [Pseudoalteromonas luteoviolacea B = ATCC 29581]